jgi:hypothetical protein
MSRQDGSSYTGWGSDDKGQPVLVVAPPPEVNAATRATRALASLLLIVVMLVALGIALLAIGVLSNSIYGDGGYQDQIEAEQRIDTGARQIVEYADELAADNELMRQTREVSAPLLIPPLQEQIDDLEEENARLRRTIRPPGPTGGSGGNRGNRPQRNEIPG